jgi:hypothetical protein
MLFSAVTFWRWLTGQPLLHNPTSVSADPGAERRVNVRYSTNLSIYCANVSDEGDPGVSALISDISRGGLKLIAPRRFMPGSVLSIELPVPQGETPLTALACVLHARPHGDTEWSMGCRFSGELNDEQLQAFGAARTRPLPPEPRHWMRYSCDARVSYQRVGKEGEPREGQLLNVATAGMAMLVDEDIPVGELLSTELRDAQGQPVVTILACVVHAQLSAEGRILGCNFIRELSDDDLHALSVANPQRPGG